MSDIDFDFSWWDILLFFAGTYWPVGLTIACALIAIGVFMHGIPRVVSWLIAAIILCISGFLPVWMYLSDLQNARHDALMERMHILKKPQMIMGLTFPAGTAVDWSDETFSDASEFDLPETTPLLGTLLTGKLTNNGAASWSGTLAAPSIIDGWPCGSGDVTLTNTGGLISCSIASDHIFYSVLIPSGANIQVRGSDGPEIDLPPNRSVTLGIIGATLPAGSRLYMDPRGSITETVMPDNGILTVDNIPLSGDIDWLYPAGTSTGQPLPPPIGLSGELAKDIKIADGKILLAGQWVNLDFRTHQISPQQ